MRRWWTDGKMPRLAAVLAVSALLAAACGGSDGASGTDGQETEPSSTPTETETQTEATDGGGPEGEPGDWEPPADLLAAAQEEGELVTYSAVANSLQTSFAEAFKARYGITLNFAQVENAAVLERSRTEFESGRVTVDWINTSTKDHHDFMVEQGAYMPLDPDEIPNLANITDTEGWLLGDSHYAFWGGVGYLLAWNSELVADEDIPDTWCDLADPKFRGQIGFVDQPGALSLYTTWAMADEACGGDWLEKMAEQEMTLYSSTSNSAPALAAGEIAITTHGLPHQFAPLVAEGAPLEWKVMETMALGPRMFAIMEGAPHPNAAKVFANWILSPEAQTIAFDGQQGVTIHPDVPDPVQLPDVWNMSFSEDWPDDLQETVRSRLGLE